MITNEVSAELWKKYLLQGIQYGQNGETDKAVIEFKKAIELSPLEPDPHGHLAWQYYCSHQYEQAINEYSTLLQLQPDNPDAKKLLGKCLFQINKFSDAAQYFKECMDSDSTDSVEILYFMSEIERTKRNYSEAIHIIKQISGKTPVRDLEEKLNGLIREKELYETMQKDPDKYLSDGYRNAHQFRNNKNWDLAVGEYEKLLIIQPENPELYFKIGCTFMERIMPRHDKAIQAFQKALLLNPLYQDAMLQLARAQALYGFVSDSIESYERLLKAYPNSREGIMELGNLYASSHEYEKAISIYKQINEKGDIYWNFNLAACFLYLKDTTHASQHINKGLASDKENILGKFLSSCINHECFFMDSIRYPLVIVGIKSRLKSVYGILLGNSKMIHCLLCKKSGHSLIHPNRPLVQCRQCGVIYVNPQPVFRELEELYDDGYMAARKADAVYCYQQREAGNPHQICMKRELDWVDSQGFKDFEAKRGKDKTFLDIGCAVGVFLLDLESRGWDAHGTDISKSAVDYCCSKGLKVRQGTLEEVNYPDESFDFIVMHHVIEHIPSPANTLKEIMRILKPGGRLFIKTPCCDSIPSILAGNKWFNDPDHIYFFSKATLLKLVESAGFSVCASHCYVGVKSETYPDFWIHHQISPLLTDLIDEADLGDVIMVMAEKP